MSRHYEAVLELNALAILKLLRPTVQDAKIQFEIDLLVKLANSVEGAGNHKLGTPVLLKLDAKGPGVRALVVRNRGTSDGKVLYDLALRNPEGSKYEYNETCPIRDVDGLYVTSDNS